MPKQTQTTLKDWSISTFYSKAWALTKENKKLWILGLAVTIFASGGSSNNFNFGDMFDSGSEDKSSQYEEEVGFLPTPVEAQTKDYTLDSSISEETTENPESLVLLDAEFNLLNLDESMDSEAGQEDFEGSEEFSIFFNALGQSMQNVFKNLPLWIYPLFAIEMIIFIIYAVIFGFFASSWSVAALIKGIARADQDADWSLTEVSQSSIKHVKSLIWLSIVPTIAIVVFSALVMAVVGIAIAIFKEWGLLTMFVAAIGLVYVWFRYLVALTWAIRHCVLEEMRGMESIKKGWTTASKTIFKTFRLGIANTIVSMLVSIVVFLPLIGVAMATVLPQILLGSFSPLAFIPAVIVLFITLPVSGLVQGILTVFTYATWHYGFIVVNQNRNEVK